MFSTAFLSLFSYFNYKERPFWFCFFPEILLFNAQAVWQPCILTLFTTHWFAGFFFPLESSEAFPISKTSVTFKRSHTQTHILGQNLDKFVLLNQSVAQCFLLTICIPSLSHHSLGNRNKSSVSHRTAGKYQLQCSLLQFLFHREADSIR